MCGICGCEGGAMQAKVVDADAEHAHEHGEPHGEGHTHDHGERDATLVKVEQSVLAKNDRHAAFNRGFFAGRGVTAINVLGSPGSGKTTLLERIVRDRAELVPMSVVEGDLATDRDAKRIRDAGAPAVQINTGGLCHLDAHAVGHAARDLAPRPGSVLFIENVGNLVCPALFDLGESERLVLFSVTEGEDKPIKYPYMFARASVVVMTKIDLLPHLTFDIQSALELARRVSPRAEVLRVSAATGEGMPALYDWLARRLPSSSSSSP